MATTIMMKIEDQVVSLELAKKLKELNVNQESLFYWEQGSWPDKFGTIHHGEEELKEKDKLLNGYEHYSAFTVAELGILLPPHAQMPTRYNSEDWWCNSGLKPLCEGHKTEADARADILIYLLENKLITL